MADRPKASRRENQRKLITVGALLVMLGGMVGLVSQSVSLYRLFCQVTGFGGTTRVAQAGERKILDRWVTVRFNADIDPALPWKFRPEQKEVRVRLGEQGMAFFESINLSDRSVKGQAVYNVTPAKVGQYFNKIDCFCFTEQTLAPGQRADMPVTFFVDPALADDQFANEVQTITLSYTFFRARDDKDDNSQVSRAPAPPAKTVN